MNKTLALLLSTIALALCACGNGGKTEDKQTVDTIPMMVMQVKKCSRLYTTEYHVHKIVTHDDLLKLNGKLLDKSFSIKLPLGKRRVAIPMDATLKAYIDFSDFQANQIHRKGDKIELTLPEPNIMLTSTKIDHAAIRKSVGFLRSDFSDEELTTYERQGREAIIRDVASSNLLESARESAARTLIPLLVQMGFKESNITITFSQPFTPADIKKMIEHGYEQQQ
jgi:hypothetical protein